MGAYDAQIDDDALDFLADVSNGDARRTFNGNRTGSADYGQGRGWHHTYYY